MPTAAPAWCWKATPTRSGGSEYNLALGQRRAEAVRRALVLQGVQDSQIEAVSFGKERPAVPGAGNDERNRRVEFRYR